jgi:MFS family permease
MAAIAPTLLSEKLLIVGVGAAAIIFLATANSTCQLTSAPEMRGRVMALYGLVFLGSTPIGGPLIGFISQHAGSRYGMGLGGVATIASGLVAGSVLMRRHFAPRPDFGGAGADAAAEVAAA